MWAVCGPPRSGTTAMLEAIAAWTTLSVRWSLPLEWATRTQCGIYESFLELPPCSLGDAGPDEVVKILNPETSLRPTRAVLMIRDPVDVSMSASQHLRQRISPVEVAGRVQAFRDTGWEIDEVCMEELLSHRLPQLFTRLARRGWPVVEHSPTLVTRALR